MPLNALPKKHQNKDHMQLLNSVTLLDLMMSCELQMNLKRKQLQHQPKERINKRGENMNLTPKSLIERMSTPMIISTESNYLKRICHGINMNPLLVLLPIQVVQKPRKSWALSKEIILQSKDGFVTHKVHQEVSPAPSGTTSLEGDQSISTLSSVLSIMYHQSKGTLDAWDQLKSSWEALNPSRKFKLVANGYEHGMPLSKLTSSPSCTKRKNSMHMGTTSITSSHQKWSWPTIKSSYMLQQSEMKLVEDNQHYSPILETSPTFTLPLLCWMGLKLSLDEPVINKVPTEHKQKFHVHLC